MAWASRSFCTKSTSKASTVRFRDVRHAAPVWSSSRSNSVVVVVDSWDLGSVSVGVGVDVDVDVDVHSEFVCWPTEAKGRHLHKTCLRGASSPEIFVSIVF